MKLPGFTALHREISSLKPLEKWLAGLTFLILLVERSWFLWQYPIHTDEAYTFTHFTNAGVWRSMSYYPIPNNHIFFSVITAVFHSVISSAFWSLRLPAMLISLLTTGLLFFMVKRLAGFWVAFLGISLFCFSNLGIYYSFQARGYFLLTGLSAAATFSLWHFVRTGNRPALAIWMVASVLGFYTVPVYLFSFVAQAGFGFSLLLLLRKYKQLFQFMGAGLVIALGTAILYWPVIAVSGKAALFNNEYVTKIEPQVFRSLFFAWLKQSENTLVGREPEGYLLAIAWLLGNLGFLVGYLVTLGRNAWSDYQFQWVFLMVWLPLGAIITVLFRQVLPDTRIWFYLSFFQFTGLAWLFFHSAEMLHVKRLAMGIAMVLIAGYAIHQARVLTLFRQNKMEIFAQYPKVVSLIRQENAEIVFVQHKVYSLFTDFAYAQRNESLQIEEDRFDPAQHYRLVVLDKDLLPPPNFNRNLYRFIYQDDYVKVYRKR